MVKEAIRGTWRVKYPLFTGEMMSREKTCRGWLVAFCRLAVDVQSVVTVVASLRASGVPSCIQGNSLAPPPARNYPLQLTEISAS